MKQYMCELQHETIGHKQCWKCYHAYPHQHKKNCNGNHCPMSNVYNQSEEIKEWLTCKPIIDLKEDKSVISNVKRLKKMQKECRKAAGLKE